MRSKLSLLLSLFLFVLAAGCSDDVNDTENNPEQTDPGQKDPEQKDPEQKDPEQKDPVQSDTDNVICLYDNLSDEVKAELPIVPVKTLEGIGQWATDIELFGDYAYVVDGTNNVIHRIHLADLSMDKNYINLGQNASPYAANADDKALYVAVQGKNSVIKYPHDDVANPVTIADNLIAPTAIYSRDGAIYIADSEYDYNDASKTGGKAYVYDESGKKAELVTTSQNPGFLEYCPKYNWLFTINSGVISFYPETKGPEKSCIDLWEVLNLKSDHETVPFRTYCVDGATFGRAIKNKGTVYIGDALKPNLYAVYIEDILKEGTQLKTIEISKDKNGLTVPVDMGEYLGVIEYNRDMFYLRKGSEEIAAYRLSKDGVAKKNPMDAVYDTKRKQLLILNANAGTVDVLKFNKQ